MNEGVHVVPKGGSLQTWDKSSAACLSSRVAYGLPVTAERLGQIERAEKLVKQFCTGQVRVRHHGDIARIEVSPENIEVITNHEPKFFSSS